MTNYREIKSRIISFISENDLIKSGDKIVLAISGGVDSMFLLNLFIDIKQELAIEIAIGHINHNLRSGSNNDEKFVIDQAQRLGIPIYVRQLDFSGKSNAENIEAWARRLRYKNLESIRNELKFNKIATAHNSNDQIETILQRLSEKSGIKGLRGIHKQTGSIIRPILTIDRKEIETVVSELAIDHIEDETNQYIDRTRNFFRHRVIPQWEELYPQLGESIQQVSDHIELNGKILNYFFEELKNKIVEDNEDPYISIDAGYLEKFPDAVAIAFIQYLIDDGKWRKHDWFDLARIYRGATPGKIYTSNGFEILKDRNKWIFRPKLAIDQTPLKIELDSSVEYGDYTISIRTVDQFTIDDNPEREYIDQAKIKNKELVIRLWRKGDSFKPIGMEGTKLVSDYLIDQKMDSFTKQQQLVLLAADEIIWLCGQRLSEKVKIDGKTKQYLELSIKSNVG